MPMLLPVLEATYCAKYTSMLQKVRFLNCTES